MEAVEKVSSEIDKVITKFSAISDHSAKLIKNEIANLEMLRSTLLERKFYLFIKALRPNELSTYFRAGRNSAHAAAGQPYQELSFANKRKASTTWNGSQRSSCKYFSSPTYYHQIYFIQSLDE